jgi:hypothetical protein
MAGTVELIPSDNAYAAIMLNLFDCTRDTVITTTNIDALSSVSCHNLRKTRTGTGLLSNPERNALGMRDDQPFPDGTNTVSWDMCSLSETQLRDVQGATNLGACKLDLTNNGWTLRATSERRVKVKCEVQCYSTLFLN